MYLPRRAACRSANVTRRGFTIACLNCSAGARSAAVWEEEQNLADDATLTRLANAEKLPGAELLSEAKRDETKAKYEQNTADAIAIEIIGSPSYVLNGEVFWGQDRLDLLDDALRSGRQPFRCDA